MYGGGESLSTWLCIGGGTLVRYGTKRRHLGYLASRHVEGSRGQNLNTPAKALLTCLDWRPRTSRSVGVTHSIYVHSASFR